jgi:small nuclear ribonucleoprotein (snRNP)-like protein
MKNDVKIQGNIHTVDENLNFHLTNIKVIDAEKNPQLVRLP